MPVADRLFIFEGVGGVRRGGEGRENRENHAGFPGLVPGGPSEYTARDELMLLTHPLITHNLGFRKMPAKATRRVTDKT